MGLHREFAAGMAQSWDMPLGVWSARDGFDVFYPESGHCTLSFVVDGTPVERIDGRFAGRSCGPDPAHFMLYPGAGDRHYASRGPIRICQIYFQPDLVQSIADAESEGRASRCELRGDRIFAVDPALRQLTDLYLYRARDAHTPPLPLEMDAYATLIGLHLVRHHTGSAPTLVGRAGALDARRLAMTLDWIEFNLGDDVSLRELAAVVGLSPGHFSTAFRRAMGAPPHQYVTARRIERAKQLLRTGKAIADIALECGFASQQHFATVFKKAVGLAPNAWRRANAP